MAMPLGTRRQRQSVWQALAVLLLVCLPSFMWPASSTSLNARILLSSDGDIGFVTEDDAEISRDGAYVVYRRYIPASRSYNIYSVPIEGGSPVHLNTHPDDPGSFGTNFQITSNSKWIVYHEIIGSVRSVPISGGSPITLSTPEADAYQTTVSPDSQNVAYVNYGKAYVVSIGGGTPVLLSTAPAGQREHGDVSMRFSPDSQHVLIQELEPVSSGDFVRSSRLFSARIDGSRTVELESPVKFDASTDFFITTDSQRVIATYASTGPLYEIHSFPIIGGTPVRLSNQYEWGNVYEPFDGDDILVRPDGSHILYSRWEDTPKRDTIVSVPAEGGDAIELAVGDGPTQVLWPAKVTADGDRIIYIRYDNRGVALYSTPVTHRAPVELTKMAPIQLGHARYAISPDGQQIIYVSEEEQEDGPIRSTLYTISVTGGEPTRIAQHPGTVTRMTISPENTRILYYVVGEEYRTWYLSSMAGDSVSEVQFMSREHQFSPDGTTIVYRFDEELYALIDGTATYLPFVSDSHVSSWTVPQ